MAVKLDQETLDAISPHIERGRSDFPYFCKTLLGIELNDAYADLGEQRLQVEGKPAWRRMKFAREAKGQGSLEGLF